MKLLMISCKQATYLLSQKEENRLSWMGRLKLQMHLSICSLCRRFEQQTRFLGIHAGHNHANATLSPESKEKMQQALNQE